jgi:hypothetical protein
LFKAIYNNLKEIVQKVQKLPLRPYTLPKFLIARRATTFAKVDCSDNQLLLDYAM